jgi:hypothetical protein
MLIENYHQMRIANKLKVYHTILLLNLSLAALYLL